MARICAGRGAHRFKRATCPTTTTGSGPRQSPATSSAPPPASRSRLRPARIDPRPELRQAARRGAPKARRCAGHERRRPGERTGLRRLPVEQPAAGGWGPSRLKLGHDRDLQRNVQRTDEGCVHADIIQTLDTSPCDRPTSTHTTNIDRHSTGACDPKEPHGAAARNARDCPLPVSGPSTSSPTSPTRRAGTPVWRGRRSSTAVRRESGRAIGSACGWVAAWHPWSTRSRRSSLAVASCSRARGSGVERDRRHPLRRHAAAARASTTWPTSACAAGCAWLRPFRRPRLRQPSPAMPATACSRTLDEMAAESGVRDAGRQHESRRHRRGHQRADRGLCPAPRPPVTLLSRSPRSADTPRPWQRRHARRPAGGRHGLHRLQRDDLSALRRRCSTSWASRPRPSDMSLGSACRACDVAFSSRGAVGFFADRTLAGAARPLAHVCRHRALLPPRTRDARRTRASTSRPLERGSRSAATARAFREHFLLPIVSAVWSTAPELILDFPVAYLLRFLDNHGLIGLRRSLQWRTIGGGSNTYVQRIVEALPIGSRARRTPGDQRRARRARRDRHDRRRARSTNRSTRSSWPPMPTLPGAAGRCRRAGAVGARRLRVHDNRVVLHTDRSVLPDATVSLGIVEHRDRRLPASGRPADHDLPHEPPASRCLAGRLPGLGEPGARAFTTSAIIVDRTFSHPLYTFRTLAAQARLRNLQGHRNTWYAGALLGYGFHEDGCRSGFEAAEMISARPRRWAA